MLFAEDGAAGLVDLAELGFGLREQSPFHEQVGEAVAHGQRARVLITEEFAPDFEHFTEFMLGIAWPAAISEHGSQTVPGCHSVGMIVSLSRSPQVKHRAELGLRLFQQPSVAEQVGELVPHGEGTRVLRAKHLVAGPKGLAEVLLGLAE
jgi:hypothetical protein